MASSSSSDAINIKVKTMAPATYELRVSRTATCADLKRELEQKVPDAPVDRQRIIYRGRAVRDDQTLGDAGVCEDDVVHLVIRPINAPPLPEPPPPIPEPSNNNMQNDPMAALNQMLQGLHPGIGQIQVGIGPYPGGPGGGYYSMAIGGGGGGGGAAMRGQNNPGAVFGALPQAPTARPQMRQRTARTAANAATGGPAPAPAPAPAPTQQQQQQAALLASSMGIPPWMLGMGPMPPGLNPDPYAANGGGDPDSPPWLHSPSLASALRAYLDRLQQPITPLNEGAEVGAGSPDTMPLAWHPVHPTIDLSLAFSRLTDGFREILQGTYLPSDMRTMMEASQTDREGRIIVPQPITGGQREGQGLAGLLMPLNGNPPPRPGQPDVLGGSGHPLFNNPGGSGGAPTPGGAAPAPGGTGGATGEGGLAVYRYLPLGLSALAELSRRTDIHLSSVLIPRMRELGGSISALPAGDLARSRVAEVRALGQHLSNSAVLLLELSRLATGLLHALQGDLSPLLFSRPSALSPDGSQTLLPCIRPREAPSPIPIQGSFQINMGGLGGLGELGGLGGDPFQAPPGAAASSTPPPASTESRAGAAPAPEGEGDSRGEETYMSVLRPVIQSTAQTVTASVAQALSTIPPTILRAQTAQQTGQMVGSIVSQTLENLLGRVFGLMAENVDLAGLVNSLSQASHANPMPAPTPAPAAAPTSTPAPAPAAALSPARAPAAVPAPSPAPTPTPAAPSAAPPSALVAPCTSEPELVQSPPSTTTTTTSPPGPSSAPSSSTGGPKGLGMGLAPKKKAPAATVASNRPPGPPPEVFAMMQQMMQSSRSTGSSEGGGGGGGSSLASAAGGGGGGLGSLMQMMMSGGGGAGGAGGGGGLGNLMQMATSIASDPAMQPMLQGAMSSLLGGGGGGGPEGGGGGSGDLGGLLSSLMGSLSQGRGGSSSRSARVEELVGFEALEEEGLDPEAAKRWRELVEEDEAKNEEHATGRIDDDPSLTTRAFSEVYFAGQPPMSGSPLDKYVGVEKKD